MTNRGTAYITFDSIGSAETAIANMHEAQLDGAVISVSIVLPRRRFSQSPPPRRALPAFERHDVRGPYRPPPPGGPGARFRSPPPRRRSPFGGPPGRYGRSGPNTDTWVRGGRRSYSRSRSPRRSPSRSRSRSYSSRSPSRSPPPRRYSGGGHGRRESPPRGGQRRRRSPSYSSYGSRSRSPSRERDQNRRR